MKSDGLPVNFTFSKAALEQIAVIRADYAEAFPHDPPFALMVGWGFPAGADEQAGPGNVVVGYYRASEIPRNKRELLEVAGGHRIVFFVREEDHRRFEGKTIDFSADRLFYLRYP